MKRIGILSLLALTLLFGCDSNRVFERNFPVPEGSWNVQEKVRFEVPALDSLQFYNVYVNLRHTADYPYSNFFIFLDTRLPDQRIMRDTIECPLANNQGQWYGSGVGDVVDNRILIKRKFRFPQSGDYTFVMVHGMREEEVPAILDVGLRVELAN